ncbi:MAG: trehalose-6-phosphate synthase [Actinomycetota bacterium]|nr:trehalose-6-phosphate synthase [Actinomycetota bacterium]
MPDRPVVLASNRGPLSFHVGEDGAVGARRGAGGLVSGLAPAVSGWGATWIAVAMTDADRATARQGVVEAEGLRTRLLAIDEDVYRAAYDVICNGTLWFLHHGLFESARQPRFDRAWHDAWAAFGAYTDAFARGVAESAPERAVVLLQDYHLSLAARRLAELRPDLSCVHFAHTPFASPEGLAMLPDAARSQLVDGLAANAACGFHTSRWAEEFLTSTRAAGADPPPTFVAPLGADADDLRTVAASPACEAALAELDERVGDRCVLARVDRVELSKNLLRGFLAFDELLERWPHWRERVTFAAYVYPSRVGLAEYVAYRAEVEQLVAEINDRWATGDWVPVLLEVSDDFPRSVAALRRYDALLVNPVRDGMNLVAKEGPLVNERAGSLLLSPETGAWDELGDASIEVHPYDISATAAAIAASLELGPDERARRAETLRARCEDHSPTEWLSRLVLAGR